MGIVTGLLKNILEWLNKGLFQGGLQILKGIIGDTLYYLSYDKIIGLLPNIVQTENVTISLFDVGMAIAWGIYIALFMVEAIKLIVVPYNGKQRSPMSTLIKYILFGAILVFFEPIMQLLTYPFEVVGKGVMSLTNGIAVEDPTIISSDWGIFNGVKDLINGVVSIGSEVIDLVGSAIIDTVGAISTEGLIGNSFGDIAQIVLSFTLFTSILGAGLIIIERYLSLAITMAMGPMFVALGASDSTSSSTKEWIKTVIIQFLAILISWFGMFMFLRYYSDHVLVWFSGVKNSWANLADVKTNAPTLFDYAFCIALLQIVKNSEKYFNALGFRTIANKDSVGEVKSAIGNFMQVMRLPMLVGHAVGFGGKVAKNISNHGNVKQVKEGLKTGKGENYEKIDKVTNGSYYKDNMSKGPDGKPMKRSDVNEKLARQATDYTPNGMNSVDFGVMNGTDAMKDTKLTGSTESYMAMYTDNNGNTKFKAVNVSDVEGKGKYAFVGDYDATNNRYTAPEKNYFAGQNDLKTFSMQDATKIDLGENTFTQYPTERTMNSSGYVEYKPSHITVTGKDGVERNIENVYGAGTYGVNEYGDIYKINSQASYKDLHVSTETQTPTGNLMYRLGDDVHKGGHENIQRIDKENFNYNEKNKGNHNSKKRKRNK